MTKKKRIKPDQAKLLVCVKDDEHSKVALRFACSQAKSTGCLIELITVIEPAVYQSFVTVADKMREEKRAEAEEVLQQFAEQAVELSGIMPTLVVKEGRIGEQILATIEEDFSINMLVIGISPESPGRTDLLPWLTARFGTKLHIPLLVVPGNLTQQQIEELT